jgi:intraflagellar transport protein 74
MRLQEQLDMRKAELDKIDMLEDKLESELDTIASTASKLREELDKYQDLDQLHQEGEEQECRLKAAHASLQARVDMMEAIATHKERHVKAKGQQLMVRSCCGASKQT